MMPRVPLICWGKLPMRSMVPPNWTAAFLLLPDSCWIFITPQKTFLPT